MDAVISVTTVVLALLVGVLLGRFLGVRGASARSRGTGAASAASGPGPASGSSPAAGSREDAPVVSAAAGAGPRQAELDRLEREVHDLTERLGRGETELRQREAEATARADELADCRRWLGQRDADLAAMRADLDLARAELDTREATIGALREELERTRRAAASRPVAEPVAGLAPEPAPPPQPQPVAVPPAGAVAAVDVVEAEVVDLTDTSGTAPDQTSPEPEAATAAPADDPLERIDGVGPKTAAALRGGGVRTFAQLGAMDEAELRAVLRGAGARVPASVSTWPEKARQLAGASAGTGRP